MAVRNELSPRFRNGQWIVQRVGWLLGLAIIVAALLGFFGSGPLTEGHEKAEGEGYQYDLSFNRWNRQKNPQDLELTVSGSELAGQTLEVTLPGSFLEDVSIERVTPEPESTTLTPEGAVYAWQLGEGDEFAVTFGYRAKDWRTIEGDFVVSTGASEETLGFSQFLFP